MGGPISCLDRVAAGARHRAASHRNSVASPRVSPFLRTKKPSPRRTPCPGPQNARIDPHDANPTWGAPRIRNELAKIGINVSRSTVAKYMVRQRKPPSPTWRTFLDNHVKDLVSLDFFVVPTATFRVLFILLVLAHDQRRILHFNVTSSPSAAWTAQQVVQAFPGDSAPRYLLRDRDCIYGEYFRRRVKNLGIKEVLSAARSPWQNPYVERLIGSIRRECLDRVILLNEQHLRRILRSYLEYYHRSRCHLSLDGDAPVPRAVQGPEMGQVIELSEVGGLHHRYVREAA